MPDLCYWASGLGAEDRLRVWEGQAVVFVCRSGDTHFLDAAGAALIQLLVAHAPQRKSSTEWLREFLGGDRPHDGFAEADTLGMHELLTSLERIGLVARFDSSRS